MVPADMFTFPLLVDGSLGTWRKKGTSDKRQVSSSLPVVSKSAKPPEWFSPHPRCFQATSCAVSCQKTRMAGSERCASLYSAWQEALSHKRGERVQ